MKVVVGVERCRGIFVDSGIARLIGPNCCWLEGNDN